MRWTRGVPLLILGVAIAGCSSSSNSTEADAAMNAKEVVLKVPGMS